MGVQGHPPPRSVYIYSRYSHQLYESMTGTLQLFYLHKAAHLSQTACNHSLCDYKKTATEYVSMSLMCTRILAVFAAQIR